MTLYVDQIQFGGSNWWAALTADGVYALFVQKKTAETFCRMYNLNLITDDNATTVSTTDSQPSDGPPDA